MALRPVFILSLPRSGSTLLQSLLASSPQVETAPEPWLLLPLVYSTRHSGVLAEYRHNDAVRAVSEFVSDTDGDLAPYWDAVGELARTMYARSAGPETLVFVDKTPRYHLIVDEIATIFPDAAFVFLWRNPLAVAASMIETWGHGHWNVDHFDVDLHRGIPNLITAADALVDRSIEVRYEDLVLDPVFHVGRIAKFLGLDPIADEAILHVEGAKRVIGRFGDQDGLRKYPGVVSERVDRWTSTFSNPLRKSWARRYLDELGEDRLARLGYDIELLSSKLHSAPGGLWGSLEDSLHMTVRGARRKARNAVLRRSPARR